jgi:hypothetical protein
MEIGIQSNLYEIFRALILENLNLYKISTSYIVPSNNFVKST